MIGHSYFGSSSSLLADLYELMHHGFSAAQRQRLMPYGQSEVSRRGTARPQIVIDDLILDSTGSEKLNQTLVSKRVLVTGAAGVIGQAVCRELVSQG